MPESIIQRFFKYLILKTLIFPTTMHINVEKNEVGLYIRKFV